MEDAFKKKLELGSKVLYSTGGGAGTVYHVGEVVKLYPTKDDGKHYSPPDRVEVKVDRTTARTGFMKNPLVYASNVVVLPV